MVRHYAFPCQQLTMTRFITRTYRNFQLLTQTLLVLGMIRDGSHVAVNVRIVFSCRPARLLTSQRALRLSTSASMALLVPALELTP